MKNVKKFEILPHTADIGLRIYGKDRKELFENAVLGLASILKKDAERRKDFSKKEKLKVVSSAPEFLLPDFLNEVLAKSQIDKAVYPKAKFTKLSENELESELSGYGVDGFNEDVKAVSYHGLKMGKKDETGEWNAILLFDI